MGRWLHDDDLEELAVILEHKILHILTESMVTLMAAIDDLNTAVTNVQASATTAVNMLEAQTTNDPAIATAAAAVQAVADQLNAATTPTP
jgi:hypothetical protein